MSLSRRRTGVAALAMVVTLGAGLTAAQAGDAPTGTGGEVWLDYAAPDDDVARTGRAAMPFTAEQIEALGRLLRETRSAASVAADPPPEGRVRRVRMGAPGEGTIPTVAVRRGYVTALSFVDVTGAPWPVEEVLMDGRFLPEAVLPEAVVHEAVVHEAVVHEAASADDGGGAGHLVYLAPQARSLHGNAAVKLLGLAEPLVLSLRGGGADADFRVEVRLGVQGPNAAPGAAGKAAFHAGDAVLLDLLGGVAAAGAERLAVDGGSADDRAWRLGGDLLLVTRADLLSPGPWAAERGTGGRWAYRLPDVPYALVSRDGNEKQIAFRARDGVQPMPAMDEEGGRQ